MTDKELNELLEYNLEYMDARLSEDVFGGNYISEVELKHLEKAYDKLHSNWNSLRECIETDNKRAKGYIERIRTSDLYHGDYPVEYYYAEKRKEITDYYLDKMNQLERNNKL